MMKTIFKQIGGMAMLLAATLTGCTNADDPTLSGDGPQSRAEEVVTNIEGVTAGALANHPLFNTSLTGVLNISGSLNANDFITLASMTGLTKLDLSGTTVLDAMYNEIDYIVAHSFENIQSAMELVLPAGIKVIGNGSFQNGALTKITGLYHVTLIEGDAFWQCSNLSEFDLSDNTNLAWGAFYGCAFKEITVKKKWVEVEDYSPTSVFANNTKLTKITFEEGITSIPHGFCSDCSNLKEVVFPSTLESIGDYAFSSTNLSSFDPTAYPALKRIGEGAFRYGLTEQIEMTIPATIEECGESFIAGTPIATLYWNSTQCPMPHMGDTDALCVLTEGATTTASTASNNIIIGGHSKLLTFRVNEDWSSLLPYSLPVNVTADEVRIIRYFNRWTYPGSVQGWESISLPFAPVSIVAETSSGNGDFSKVIAPWDAGVEGAYPFWLRELTTDGFKDVPGFEPNKPYIICMPHSHYYLPEYNINGWVMFTGKNVTLKKADEVAADYITTQGPGYKLVPTFTPLEPSPYRLGLNHGSYRDLATGNWYEPGANFIDNQSIGSFSAYAEVTSGTATRTIPIESIAGTRAAKRTPGSVPHKDDL